MAPPRRPPPAWAKAGPGKRNRPTTTVPRTIARARRWYLRNSRSRRPHHGVSSHRTPIIPISRPQRTIDPKPKYPRMLIIAAVTQRIDMKMRKRFGRTNTLRLIDRARTRARPSAPWVMILPIDVGIGTRTDLAEYGRTFRNSSPQIQPMRRRTDASLGAAASASARTSAGAGVRNRERVVETLTSSAAAAAARRRRGRGRGAGGDRRRRRPARADRRSRRRRRRRAAPPRPP